jgi:hypothetical protein
MSQPKLASSSVAAQQCFVRRFLRCLLLFIISLWSMSTENSPLCPCTCMAQIVTDFSVMVGHHDKDSKGIPSVPRNELDPRGAPITTTSTDQNDGSQRASTLLGAGSLSLNDAGPPIPVSVPSVTAAVKSVEGQPQIAITEQGQQVEGKPNGADPAAATNQVNNDQPGSTTNEGLPQTNEGQVEGQQPQQTTDSTTTTTTTDQMNVNEEQPGMPTPDGVPPAPTKTLDATTLLGDVAAAAAAAIIPTTDVKPVEPVEPVATNEPAETAPQPVDPVAPVSPSSAAAPPVDELKPVESAPVPVSPSPSPLSPQQLPIQTAEQLLQQAPSPQQQQQQQHQGGEAIPAAVPTTTIPSSAMPARPPHPGLQPQPGQQQQQQAAGQIPNGGQQIPPSPPPAQGVPPPVQPVTTPSSEGIAAAQERVQQQMAGKHQQHQQAILQREEAIRRQKQAVQDADRRQQDQLAAAKLQQAQGQGQVNGAVPTPPSTSTLPTLDLRGQQQQQIDAQNRAAAAAKAAQEAAQHGHGSHGHHGHWRGDGHPEHPDPHNVIIKHGSHTHTQAETEHDSGFIFGVLCVGILFLLFLSPSSLGLNTVVCYVMGNSNGSSSSGIICMEKVSW